MSWNRADDGEQYEVARRLNAEAGRTWTVMWAPALRAYVAFYQGTATVRWQSAPTPQGLMDRLREAERGLEAGRPPAPRDNPRNVGAHRCRPASPRTPEVPAAHDDAGPTATGGTTPAPAAGRGTTPAHADLDHQATPLAAAAQEATRVPALAHAAGHGDARPVALATPPMSVGAHAAAEAAPEQASHTPASTAVPAAGRSATPEPVPASTGVHTVPAHTGPVLESTSVHAIGSAAPNAVPALARTGFAPEAAPAHTAGGDDTRDAGPVPAPTFAVGRATAQEATRAPVLAHAAGHGDVWDATPAPTPMFTGEDSGSGTVSAQAGTEPEGAAASAAARPGVRPGGVPARAGSRVASRAALRRAGLGGDPDRSVATARLRGPRSGSRAVVIPWEETPPARGSVGVEESVSGGSAS